MTAGRNHTYAATVTWTGNRGEGTVDYRAYSRDHDIRADGKPPIAGSSDPAFGGDASRYNPEDLLVASLSSCYMLWYLHLCAAAGVRVHAHADQASGIMRVKRRTAAGFAGSVKRLLSAVGLQSPCPLRALPGLTAVHHRTVRSAACVGAAATLRLRLRLQRRPLTGEETHACRRRRRRAAEPSPLQPDCRPRGAGEANLALTCRRRRAAP